MSMLSDAAIFVIADPTLNEPPKPKEEPSTSPPKLTVTTPPSQVPATDARKPPPQNANYAPPPITEFMQPVISGESLKIEWKPDQHASDYHIFWDQGKGGEFVKLTPTTKGANHFTLDKSNSGGIIGSQ